MARTRFILKPQEQWEPLLLLIDAKARYEELLRKGDKLPVPLTTLLGTYAEVISILAEALGKYWSELFGKQSNLLLAWALNAQVERVYEWRKRHQRPPSFNQSYYVKRMEAAITPVLTAIGKSREEIQSLSKALAIPFKTPNEKGECIFFFEGPAEAAKRMLGKLGFLSHRSAHDFLGKVTITRKENAIHKQLGRRKKIAISISADAPVKLDFENKKRLLGLVLRLSPTIVEGILGGLDPETAFS